MLRSCETGAAQKRDKQASSQSISREIKPVSFLPLYLNSDVCNKEKSADKGDSS